MKKSVSVKMNDTVVMDQSVIFEALASIAETIVENHRGDNMMALVGIRTGGIHLARRLLVIIQKQLGCEVPIGTLDINLYRDDLLGRARQPVLGTTDIPFDVTDRNIVLVDDVLFTGRTIRAAMDSVMDLGRPARIQLAILVDRGHRELPIAPDYVGRERMTTQSQMVKVRLQEEGYPADAVIITSQGPVHAT